MTDTLPVALGSLLLTGIEVPSFFDREGRVRTSLHHVIGGDRVLQILGVEPQRRKFTGCFVGPQAAEKGQLLEAMRDAMAPYVLTMGSWTELVIITDLTIRYQAQGNVVRYMISAEPMSTTIDASVATEVTVIADIAAALASCAAVLGDATSATPFSALQTTLSATSATAAAMSNAQDVERLDLMSPGSLIGQLIGSSGTDLQSIAQRSATTDIVANSGDLMFATSDAQNLAVGTRAAAYLNQAGNSVSMLVGTTPSPIVYS